MTENKRYSFNWKSGHPNFWDNHCDLADCYLTCEDVVDRLNDLHDENQELKKKNKQLSICEKRIIELENENEQLKQELIELKKWEKYVGDVKREDLDEVFKMSIYEIAEAFAYYEKRIKELEE